jgi:hypothetical protein
VTFLLLLLGCDGRAEQSLSAKHTCPDGMVLVTGPGRVGMRGQPYGVVETAHLKHVEAPEKRCTEAISSTPGATACWVQTDLVDPVLSPRRVEFEPFCIDRYPFPGKGSKYTTDGLNVWTAHRLNEVLGAGRFGARRLCSASEFQVAVAGPQANLRFVYGDEFVEGRCQGDLIGTDSACRNSETTVHEYGAVHSHWTVADKAFVTSACGQGACQAAGNRPLREGMYIVMGGTGRLQTRQAPYTPHTWHDHGDPTADACGFEGWDDQPVICADPGPLDASKEAAWLEFVQSVRAQGTMRKALQVALVEKICPD